MDKLFDTYSELMQPMTEFFMKKYPKPAEVSDTAYAASIRAKACDTLRGLLPLGTLTNIGVFSNGRAIEYLLTRLKAEELPELQDISEQLLNECKQQIENFVERVESEKGQKYAEYISMTKKTQVESGIEKKNGYKVSGQSVKMTGYDKEGETKIALPSYTPVQIFKWRS
jgi:thymidylate synthase ThyX